MSVLAVRRLGLVPYTEAVRLQEVLVLARRRGSIPDTLLLLEHPPVLTLGRSSDRDHVLADPASLHARGVEVHETGRGGDVTWHGPGQLVGYPIVALRGAARDAHAYLRSLEEALLRTVADFGVAAHRLPGLTGIWAGTQKLGAIGVRLSTHWVTSHGFALNVDPDLGGFDLIVPCGIPGCGVSSLAVLTGRSIPMGEVARRAAHRTAEVLGLHAVWKDLAEPAPWVGDAA